VDLEHAPVIGTVGPVADGRDIPFWDGLAEGRLLIQHCPGCGAWVWPTQWACPECHRFDPVWEEVEPRGTVFSWTRTWQKFTPEFASLVPYITVVVELDGAGGTRLLGLLLGNDELDPVLGEPVEGVFQAPSELTTGAGVLRWRRTGNPT
jgi:uncharacterized OB-fold protein